MVEKQRATLEFEVSEDEIEGRWLRNGVEIQFSQEKRFNYVAIRMVHRLTIAETYQSDAGEYTFIAGKNRSTVNLHVNSECFTTSSSNYGLVIHSILNLCFRFANYTYSNVIK